MDILYITMPEGSKPEIFSTRVKSYAGKLSAMMPEASKPNIHGYIHGRTSTVLINTSGVEDT